MSIPISAFQSPVFGSAVRRCWVSVAVGLLVASVMFPAGARGGPLLGEDAERLTTDGVLKDILKLSPSAGDQPGFAEVQQAVEYFRGGDNDSALREFKKAREANPDLPPAQLMLARLHLASGRLSAGRVALEQAAVEAPDEPIVYLAFGDLALHDGRLTDAQVHFSHAARLLAKQEKTGGAETDGDVRVSAGLAAVAERRQDWPAAEAALSEWLAREPDDALARERLGRVLFHLERREEAFETLRAAVETDEALEPAAVSMAWLHQQAGDMEKADEWMDYALKTHSGDARVVRAAASRLLELGRTEEAQQQVARLRQLDPDAQSDRRLEGLIARHHGDYGSAERIFEALYQESPADFAAANQLALVLIEQDNETKRRRALQLAEINARQYPRSAEALATLGWVYYRLGRVEQAKRVLQSAISGGRASSETAYYLARLLADAGQAEQARLLLEGAVTASGPFAYRADARDRLEQLKSAPSQSRTPASSPASR